jgi:thiol-disulfide isomerase/thioredoxin
MRDLKWRVTPRSRKALALALTILAVALLAAAIASDVESYSKDLTAKSSGQSFLALGFARVNRPAFAFNLPLLSGGRSIRLSQLKGRPVVLNFWSSSCGVCKTETPAIARIALADGKGISFIGIDTADLKSAAQEFVRRYRLTYPIAFDPNAGAAARFAVPGLPTTVFLSRTTKRVVGVNVGALTSRSLAHILHMLYG